MTIEHLDDRGDIWDARGQSVDEALTEG